MAQIVAIGVLSVLALLGLFGLVMVWRVTLFVAALLALVFLMTWSVCNSGVAARIGACKQCVDFMKECT